MEKVLIIGCGDIALRVAGMLRARYRLFGLLRHAERSAELRAAGIIPLHGDLDDRHSLYRLAGLADTVLHFAPPPNMGQGDPRTRHLLAALSRGKLPGHLLYISTSGVYGDCGGAAVCETHPLNPQSARAQRRVDAERQIRNWARRNRVHAGILRVPGIYADNRLPLERLRAGTPAIEATADSYTNHIHAEDLARIVIAATGYAKPNRVYHASDDSDLKMGDYFDLVADTHALPHPPRLPREVVERAVSPTLWSFMNESRRLGNTRMKRELKVMLRYPTVADMLQDMQAKRHFQL
ncbi:MAG: NAD-dependent epimerase/dehydratase family protein [Sideroxydans sp.]|nr:NAD-dependent epimerase/dehydratase family protein [Sideroxydans sp.]